MLIRNNHNLLVKVTAVVCALSVLLFSFLLLQSSDSRNRALASNYSPDQVILAVNQERLRNGLPALIVNPQLASAAQNKANHMAENEYFSHIGYGKKWSDFIRESGYDYAEAGENLANGFNDVGSMTSAWMQSPSHRENILNANVSETGVGIAYGRLDGYPTIFVAQVFGRKMERQTAPQPQNLIPSTQPAEPTPNPQPEPQPTPQPNPNPQPEPQPEPIPRSLGELLELPEATVGQ